MFFTAGISFIFYQLNREPTYSFSTATDVVLASYDETEDLTKVSGEHVIGLVNAALNGEYDLIIDGVPINAVTDIRDIDLRGVVGNTYNMTLLRQNGVIHTVSVTH